MTFLLSVDASINAELNVSMKINRYLNILPSLNPVLLKKMHNENKYNTIYFSTPVSKTLVKTGVIDA